MEPHVELEAEIGRWAGFPPENVVACSSGTAALHLALEALKLPPRSTVVCPDFTMIACPRAITLAGLRPVFVDCDDRLCMDPRLAVEPQRTASAILAVHIYGRRCPMDWKTDAYTHRRIKVVEDLAEAHGIEPHPSSDAACWSFYRNKIVAGEEGGAVAFKDPVPAALARQLRSLGFTEAHDFNHVPRGHNYRLAPSLARHVLWPLRAWGQPLSSPDPNLVGLDILGQRRVIEGWYDRACPQEWKMPPRDVVWVYDIRIPGLQPQKQMEVIRYLNQRGIAARRAFQPMSRQSEYRICGLHSSTAVEGVEVKRESVSEVMAREVLYLPVQPGRTTEGQVVDTFSLLKGLV